MQSAKRRRLDQVQVQLHKPFRSPLRTTKNTVDNHNLVITRSSGNSPTDSIITASNVLGLPPTGVSNPTVPNTTEKGLTQKLRQTRQALDTAQQALQIVTSHQDIQLEALITKWTHIARDAADELFIDAKALIEDMGGIDAWQRKTKTDSQLWAEDNRYEHPDADDSTRQDEISTGELPASVEGHAGDQVSPFLQRLVHTNIPVADFYHAGHVETDEYRLCPNRV